MKVKMILPDRSPSRTSYTGTPVYVRPSGSNPSGMQPHKCGRMCFLAVACL